jgi:hypothetical protein
MPFDLDAFISYAHIDNEPLTPGQRGWVSQFHSTLQTMLSQRLGEKARIWRDDKLGGNDIFADEIVDQFARTALLVTILSPRYLKSEWCTRELHEFCAAAASNGGVTVGNKSRVFKVVKTPVDAAAALPEAVQQTLAYEFFAANEAGAIELDPAFGDEARQQFLSKLSGLAWELARILQNLRQAAALSPAAATTTTAPAAAQPGRVVLFLADCGRDLRDVREQLATELRMHGHDVVAAPPGVNAEDTLRTEIAAQLERCALSIHLVGRSVGPVPDGPSGMSLAMLENQLAAERCRQSSLKRLIWLGGGIVGERPEQQSFIDALQRDAALQFGADLLRGDIQAFKGQMHSTLRQFQDPVAATAPAALAGPAVVHLLMSEADRSASVPLLKLLRAAGLKVTIPVFVGDAASLREANTQLLAGCDALILFYGAGDEVWKFHQHNEVRKRSADPAARSGCSEWTALAPPLTADKELLQALAEPGLIDGLAGWSAAALQELFSALTAARAGQ